MNLHRMARSCPASRALLVDRVRNQGWNVAEAAGAAGLSVRRAYEWLRRSREGDVELADRSSRPHRSPTKLPPEWESMVLTLRQSRMTQQAIAETLGLSKARVGRVCRQAGIGRLPPAAPPEPVCRYERKRPGELVHLDVKKLGRIGRPGHRVHGDRTTRVRGIGWEFVHVCIDDASRVAYVEVLEDERGSTSTAFLRRAAAWFERRGIRIERVMTDNGSGYVSFDFARACAELEARHLRTRPYRPCTNGKAERFIQTLLREWAYAAPYPTSAARTRSLPGFLHRYNHHRPHSALQGAPPMAKLTASQVNDLVSLHS
jgi:transposase InsO family protein